VRWGFISRSTYLAKRNNHSPIPAHLIHTFKMVSLSFLALAASSLFALATAAPAIGSRQAPVWTPGTQNNTQEFYIKLHVTHGPKTYEGYYCSSSIISFNHSLAVQLTFTSTSIPHWSRVGGPCLLPQYLLCNACLLEPNPIAIR
jgi:hypothetical protein